MEVKIGYVKIKRMKRERIYPFKPLGYGRDRSLNIMITKKKMKNIPMVKNGKLMQFRLCNRIEYLSQYPITNYLYGKIEDKECIYPAPNYEVLYRMTIDKNREIEADLVSIRSEMNNILNIIVDQSKIINKIKEELTENTLFIDRKKYEENLVADHNARKRRREKFEEEFRNKTDIEKMYGEWLWMMIES